MSTFVALHVKSRSTDSTPGQLYENKSIFRNQEVNFAEVIALVYIVFKIFLNHLHEKFNALAGGI